MQLLFGLLIEHEDPIYIFDARERLAATASAAARSRLPATSGANVRLAFLTTLATAFALYSALGHCVLLLGWRLDRFVIIAALPAT